MDKAHQSVNYREGEGKSRCSWCWNRSIRNLPEGKDIFSCGLLVAKGSNEPVHADYVCDNHKPLHEHVTV